MVLNEEAFMEFKRGTLIVYDVEGRVLFTEGDLTSNVEITPFNYPVGVPYLELPYGESLIMDYRLKGVDVSTEPHKPIWEKIIRELTPAEQLIESLENELLIANGVI
jgi:hypothetical protein